MSAKICNQTTRSDDGTAPVSQSTNAVKSVRQNWSGLWWTVSYKTGKRKTESQEISVSFYVLDDKGSPLGDELYLGH